MKSKIITILLLLLCCKPFHELTTYYTYEFKIYDLNSNLINSISINDSTELTNLKAILQSSKLIPELKIKPNWNYKIKIASNMYNETWIYDTSGIIAKLNYNLKPAYEITKNNEFIEIILKKTNEAK